MAALTMVIKMAIFFPFPYIHPWSIHSRRPDLARRRDRRPGQGMASHHEGDTKAICAPKRKGGQ